VAPGCRVDVLVTMTTLGELNDGRSPVFWAVGLVESVLEVSGAGAGWLDVGDDGDVGACVGVCVCVVCGGGGLFVDLCGGSEVDDGGGDDDDVVGGVVVVVGGGGGGCVVVLASVADGG